MKLYTERVQHIEDLCQRATADADEVLKCVAGDAAGQVLEYSSPLTQSGLGPSYFSMTGLNDAVVASSPDDAVPGSSTCATVSAVEFSNWASNWPSFDTDSDLSLENGTPLPSSTRIDGAGVAPPSDKAAVSSGETVSPGTSSCAAVMESLIRWQISQLMQSSFGNISEACPGDSLGPLPTPQGGPSTLEGDENRQSRLAGEEEGCLPEVCPTISYNIPSSTRAKLAMLAELACTHGLPILVQVLSEMAVLRWSQQHRRDWSTTLATLLLQQGNRAATIVTIAAAEVLTRTRRTDSTSALLCRK